MRSLIRAVLGTDRRHAARYPGYIPTQWGTRSFEDFKVSGEALLEASRNYHASTFTYMFGAGTFQSVRLDLPHLVRLVNRDRDYIMNRRMGGRLENVYTISLRLAGEDTAGSLTYEPLKLVPVLASDYDAWMRAHWGD